MSNKKLVFFVRAGFLVLVVMLFTSCETFLSLFPPDVKISGSEKLETGSYTLTPLERRAIREIFGPQVARWADKHLAIRSDHFFSSGDADVGYHRSGFYDPEIRSVRLRTGDNDDNLVRFATIIHEVTHYWQHLNYRHFESPPYASMSVREIYEIPPQWVDLNIEQEAELVSIYAVLKYAYTSDAQIYKQFDTEYTRRDLDRMEEYMQREMYF